MPEWPEMETYRQLLSPRVTDRVIRDVAVYRDKSVNVPVEVFRAGTLDRRILFLERRGKQLLFHLDDGYRLVLHLMLGGYMHYGAEEPKEEERYQVVLTFDDGNKLFFGGLRLGYLHWLSAKAVQESLKELGPDPFDPRLTPDSFHQRLTKRRSRLKTALVDQKFLSGIGNCYSDEMCFEARIHPETKASGMDRSATGDLYTAMRKVLTFAAEAGGYMDTPLTPEDSLTGGYNDKCLVYDRGGEPCVRCGTEIVLETVSARKMFYCPSCQPKPAAE